MRNYAQILRERLTKLGLALSMLSGGVRIGMEVMTPVSVSQNPVPLVSTNTGVPIQGAPGHPPNPLPPSNRAPNNEKLELVLDDLRKRKKRNRSFVDLSRESMISRVAVARNGTTILLTPRREGEADIGDTLRGSQTFNNGGIMCEHQDGTIALATNGLPLAPETLVRLLVQAELIVPDDAEDCLGYLKESLKRHAPSRS